MSSMSTFIPFLFLRGSRLCVLRCHARPSSFIPVCRRVHVCVVTKWRTPVLMRVNSRTSRSEAYASFSFSPDLNEFCNVMLGRFK